VSKGLLIFGSVFLLVGLGLLTGAYFSYSSTKHFLAHAVDAQGTVIELERRESTDSDGRSSTMFYPVVEFQTDTGKKIIFHESSGSNPPAYAVGDSTPILYTPENPSEASINSFLSLWLGALIFSFLGSMFSLIGGSIVFSILRKARQTAWLKEFGQTVVAEVTEIYMNTSLKVNGRSPWVIACQYHNLQTNTVVVCKSENLWFDPSKYIQMGQHLSVKINPQKPRQYWVNTDAVLPKSA
jgi:hypothetical protein